MNQIGQWVAFELNEKGFQIRVACSDKQYAIKIFGLDNVDIVELKKVEKLLKEIKDESELIRLMKLHKLLIEQKKEFGQLLNEFKQFTEAKFEELKNGTSNTDPDSYREQAANIDLSLPGDPAPLGSRHPVTMMRNRMVSIFQRLGFAVAEGPFEVVAERPEIVGPHIGAILDCPLDPGEETAQQVHAHAVINNPVLWLRVVVHAVLRDVNLRAAVLLRDPAQKIAERVRRRLVAHRQQRQGRSRVAKAQPPVRVWLNPLP